MSACLASVLTSARTEKKLEITSYLNKFKLEEMTCHRGGV